VEKDKWIVSAVAKRHWGSVAAKAKGLHTHRQTDRQTVTMTSMNIYLSCFFICVLLMLDTQVDCRCWGVRWRTCHRRKVVKSKRTSSHHHFFNHHLHRIHRRNADDELQQQQQQQDDDEDLDDFLDHLHRSFPLT